MAFMCPIRLGGRSGKNKRDRLEKERPAAAHQVPGALAAGAGDTSAPLLVMGRITGSASIETLVRVGLEKEHGLTPNSKMVVVRDFTPCVDDEMCVRRGQIVHALYQENNWMYVISEDGSREGFIPDAYCAPFGSEPAELAISFNQQEDLLKQQELQKQQQQPQQQTICDKNTPKPGERRSKPVAGEDPNCQSSLESSVAQSDAEESTGAATSFSTLQLFPPFSQTTANVGNNSNNSGGNVGRCNLRADSDADHLHPFFKDPAGRYLVLYNFTARDENDVPVERGELVTVLNRDDPDWFWVEKTNGLEGFVPSAFVYPADVIETNTQPLPTSNRAADRSNGNRSGMRAATQHHQREHRQQLQRTHLNSHKHQQQFYNHHQQDVDEQRHQPIHKSCNLQQHQKDLNSAGRDFGSTYTRSSESMAQTLTSSSSKNVNSHVDSYEDPPSKLALASDAPQPLPVERQVQHASVAANLEGKRDRGAPDVPDRVMRDCGLPALPAADHAGSNLNHASAPERPAHRNRWQQPINGVGATNSSDSGHSVHDRRTPYPSATVAAAVAPATDVTSSLSLADYSRNGDVDDDSRAICVKSFLNTSVTSCTVDNRGHRRYQNVGLSRSPRRLPLAYYNSDNGHDDDAGHADHAPPSNCRSFHQQSQSLASRHVAQPIARQPQPRLAVGLAVYENAVGGDYRETRPVPRLPREAPARPAVEAGSGTFTAPPGYGGVNNGGVAGRSGGSGGDESESAVSAGQRFGVNLKSVFTPIDDDNDSAATTAAAARRAQQDTSSSSRSTATRLAMSSSLSKAATATAAHAVITSALHDTDDEYIVGSIPDHSSNSRETRRLPALEQHSLRTQELRPRAHSHQRGHAGQPSNYLEQTTRNSSNGGSKSLDDLTITRTVADGKNHDAINGDAVHPTTASAIDVHARHGSSKSAEHIPESSTTTAVTTAATATTVTVEPTTTMVAAMTTTVVSDTKTESAAKVSDTSATVIRDDSHKSTEASSAPNASAGSHQRLETRPGGQRHSAAGSQLVMLYDYHAQASDDLDVRRGEWIFADLRNQMSNDWLWAYSPRLTKYGYIPSAYARTPANACL